MTPIQEVSGMTNHFDVLIIGAAVSGIGTACQVTAR